MATKSTKSKKKTKSVSKGKLVIKAKAAKKSDGAVKAKTARRAVSSTKVKSKAVVWKEKPATKSGHEEANPKMLAKAKPAGKPGANRTPVEPVEITRKVAVTPVVVKRAVTPMRRSAQVASAIRAAQFAFMKAPVAEHAFEVGDNVEVFCDHEKGRERVRGWIKGIVVQVDNKMVAVQFRSNVFLTDGWMVPDRILWYPLGSEHIRPVPGKKSASKRDIIPDY